MTFKEFIKPTLAKIILTIIMFLVAPMKVPSFGGTPKWEWFMVIKLIINKEFIFPYFLLGLLILLGSYLVSIIIIHIYNKVMNK